MIATNQNPDEVVRKFRYETKKSGITTQLLLKKIAKPSERRKAKERIARRRRKQAEKRKGGYQRGNDEGQ